MSASAHLQILLVDDEEPVLESLERCLVDCDVVTHRTTDPRQGLELARVVELALVIADYRMVGMSGTDFLEQMRELSPRTVRVMLTGHGDVKAATDAINRAGVFSFLHKPWDDAELVGVVKQSIYHYELELERRRLQRELYTRNARLRKFHMEILGGLDRLEARFVELERMLSKLRGDLGALRTGLEESATSGGLD